MKTRAHCTAIVAARTQPKERTARIVVTFKKKGAYPYLCTVPGHAAAGMKGVFTVH